MKVRIDDFRPDVRINDLPKTDRLVYELLLEIRRIKETQDASVWRFQLNVNGSLPEIAKPKLETITKKMDMG